MNRSKGSVLKKYIMTLASLEKIAYHHYGNSISSLPKFIFYSLFNRNTFILFGTELDKELPPYPIEREFRIVKPTADELSEHRAGKSLPREFYYDQIHSVTNCYLVLHGNDIAYINWVYFKGDPSRFLNLSDGVAELNYNTALSKYRGRGLMRKMVSYISHDLQTSGYIKVVSVIHELNPPAIKSVKRAGWRELGRIRTFGPFNRKIDV